ncbi:MAG: DUF4382 domain-containing protein [Candidatus Micrarchaeota archaeon]|nr:DUF4382 domain-containing protein [Candidatus Micrarchaeota archaeon]
MANAAGFIIAGVVVIAILIFAGVYLGGLAQAAGPTNSMPIQLTDPPQVPNGTTALVVTYSGIMVHEEGKNTTGFVNVTGSGSINLLTLTNNVSQIIAIAKISANSSVDLVRFNITGATITINGTTYNVSVPSKTLSVRVEGNEVGENTTAVVQLSPTVIQLYAGNQTKFVMVPSAIAVRLRNAQVNATARGEVDERLRLNGTAIERLNRTTPSIAITSESLAVSGNQTTFSVTVQDRSNQSVAIRHVLVKGLLEARFNGSIEASATGEGHSGVNISANGGLETAANASEGHSNASGHVSINASANVSVKDRAQGRPVFVESSHAAGGISIGMMDGVSLNASTMHELENGSINGSDVMDIAGKLGYHINATIADNWATRLHSEMNATVAEDTHIFNVSSAAFKEHLQNVITFDRQYHRVLNFVVGTNGTMSLPFDERSELENTGYTLAPGNSITLTYTGTISLGDGHFVVTPLANETYTIAVSGEEGARAMVNVTAS